jgi:hypothetical protein
MADMGINLRVAAPVSNGRFDYALAIHRATCRLYTADCYLRDTMWVRGWELSTLRWPREDASRCVNTMMIVLKTLIRLAGEVDRG